MKAHLEQKRMRIPASPIVSLCLMACQLFGLVIAAPGNRAVNKPQLISIGLLTFQDESGSNAPPEIGQAVAQELRRKIIANYKDMLPRLITPTDSAPGAQTLEQLATIGRQHGFKFIVRGGILNVSADNVNGEARIRVQLYADILTVETASLTSVPAEGSSAQTGSLNLDWKASSFDSQEFRNSAVGQAFAIAIEQLAASIYQTINSPQTPTPTPSATPNEAAQAVESDEELQQLFAQAESLIANGASLDGQMLEAIKQAMQNLQAALADKAQLLEQAQDTAQADQAVKLRKQELQTAVDDATQQLASASIPPYPQPGGEPVPPQKKNVLEEINKYLDAALSILQKIQEIRALFRGNRESDMNVPPPDWPDGSQPPPPQTPIEEAAGEISGSVTDGGNPVVGASITDQDFGISATTDDNGFYMLTGIADGRLVKLVVQAPDNRTATGQVELLPGIQAILDFDLKPQGNTMPGAKILPSLVLVRRPLARGAPTGEWRGQVRDPQGRPIARTLVSLKGIAVARTNLQGRYAFLNVPAGPHVLIIQQRGFQVRTQQVQVTPGKTNGSEFGFDPKDREEKQPPQPPIRGSGKGAALRGAVTDKGGRLLAGAKITLMRAPRAVSVWTNLRGNYEFRDLQPGQYRLVISKANYETIGQSVSVSAGKTESRDFQLKPLDKWIPLPPNPPPPHPAMKGQLIGRVVDKQSQKAIPEAMIAVQGRVVGRTDKDGNYEIRNLAPGRHRISVTKADFSEQSRDINIDAARATRADFALSRRDIIPTPPPSDGQLIGRVIDRQSQRPLPGALIAVRGRVVARTDRNGNYEARNLAPGRYAVTVTRDDFSGQSRDVTIRAGQTMRENFTLERKRQIPGWPGGSPPNPPTPSRSGEVSGMISDARTGRPIADATVSLSGRQPAITNSRGAYTITNLPPSSYQVVVRKTGYMDARGSVTVRSGESATASFRLIPLLRPTIPR